MSCKVKIRHHNEVPVIQITGELSGSESARASKKIIDQCGVKTGTVVIDLRETTFIDSHGLGVLVYAWRRLEESGKNLVFLDPPSFVQNILEGTNLANVLTVIDSLESL